MKLYVRAFCIAIASVCFAPFAGAQSYPEKAVRLIVPFAPGGSTDIMARLLGARLSEPLRQPVIVDNRGGAGTLVGTEIAARTPPDGYTLLMTNIAFSLNPGLHGKKLPYDPVRDFAAITLIASQPTVLAVHPSLPVKTVADLVRLAKQKPGELSFASSGIGGVGHIAGEMFKTATGTKLIHVPYKGGGPAVIDLVTGQVMVAFIGMPTAMAHAKAGKIRFVAVTDGRSASAAPDVPTIAQAGIAGFRVDNWIGLFAPAQTPQNIVARLHEEVLRVLKQDTVREKLAAQGFEIIGSTPTEFAALVKSDIDKYTKVIESAAIRAD